jgi:uncharacterized iron-regulated membrane protein
MLIFLHRWLGLALCVLLIIISVSGSLLLWKKEYLWLTIEQSRESPNRDQHNIANAIDTISDFYAAEQISRIDLFAYDLALHKVYLTDDSTAWHTQTGKKIVQWQGTDRFEDWLLDLHHRFLLGNSIGLNIAGFSGLLLVPLMLLGLFIWWPRKHMLKMGLLPNKKQLKTLHRGALIRSHSNLGAVFILPLLIIAITGVNLVYPFESKQVLVTPFINDDSDGEITDRLDNIYGDNEASWFRVIERSIAMHPQARIRWVSFPGYFSPYKVIGLQQINDWNALGQTTIYIEADMGYMDVNTDSQAQSIIERIYNFSYPLHTARLGLWYRLLTTLTGLALFIISCFGVIAYYKKRPLQN